MSIKITAASFSACTTSKEGLPDDGMPVIALVGRSNVGKSSLINTITGRKELARTSSLPGKTLTINYYCINDSFYIVDLPGYGYAKASKVTRAKIQMMMDDFFRECKNLKGVVQIIDIRHKPSTLDIQMHEWLQEQRFNGFAVLTKTDKLSNQQVIKMKNLISKDIYDVYTSVFSSKNGNGKEEFLDAVEKILAGYQFKVHSTLRHKNVDENKLVKVEMPGLTEGKMQDKQSKTQKVERPVKAKLQKKIRNLTSQQKNTKSE